jgi:HK97 family phage major capsid protein
VRNALAIKSETESTLTLEGWGVVFGGEDLQGDYFDAKTNFWLTELGSTKPFLYEHGFDSSLKSSVLGTCTLELKTDADGTEGLWLNAQLDKSRGYVAQVAKLAKAGALGASSGAVSHLVERDETKAGASYVKAWPIAEMSGTVTPAEPRTLGVAEVRSLVEYAETLKTLLDTDATSQKTARARKNVAARARKAGFKAVSFEQIQNQIYAAINRTEYQPFDGYDPDYSCVVATYPDSVVVERIDLDADGDGGLWRIAYTADANGDVTLGEPVRVEVIYAPVAKSLRSIVEHAEALKGLLPKEIPAQGVSQSGIATPPTTAEIKVSARPTPTQEPSMTPEEMKTLTDAVSAQFAPQLDSISQVLARFENEPALKNAGIVSGTGGTSDKSIKSFADYLLAVKRNDVKRLTEVYAAKAALAEDDGTTGGYLLPTEFRSELLQIAAENAIVRPRAFVLPMGAREMEIPALDQQTAQAAGTSAFYGGASFKWAAEAAAYDETEPKFKMIRLVAHKLEGYTLSSNEMLADSAIALEAFLKRLFGNAIGWYEDFAFLQGNGVGKPLGVLNAACAVVVTRTTSNLFKVADIGNMLSNLTAQSYGKAVWVMHQSLIPQLIALSLTNATIVSFVSNLNQKLPAQLMGIPIVFTEKVPVLGTKGDVMLCDFSAYVVGDRQQVAIASSEHFKFTNGQITWRVDERVDGQPWMKTAITLADGAWQVSPFVILNT